MFPFGCSMSEHMALTVKTHFVEHMAFVPPARGSHALKSENRQRITFWITKTIGLSLDLSLR
jgi:hypothetical protein